MAPLFSLRRAPRALRILAVAALLQLAPAMAFAQLRAEGVVYSFMQMRVGTAEQYLLVPMTTDVFRPDAPMQSSIPAAFGLLRAGKPAIYGNSSIGLSDADIAARRVTVNLDPAVVPNFEIIAAETVVTFAQLGVETVVFPGVDDDGMTRAEVSYGVWRLQVPLWQAVLGGPIYGSDVVLPDGSVVASDEFTERLAAGDSTLHAHILEVAQSDNRTAAYHVLTTLPSLAIPDYETSVIPVLANPDAALRGAALTALATTQREDALDAIVALQQNDEDPALRQVAAQILAASPVERYRVFELFFRARTLDVAGRVAAIQSMVDLADERVDPELRSLVADPDPVIAMTAADTLAARSAWDELLNVTADEALTPDLRLAAASSVATGATGEQRLGALRFRIFMALGEPALLALQTAAALTDVSPWPVVEEVLATHPDITVRIAAATAIGATGSEGNLAALSAVGNDAAAPLDLGRAVREAAFSVLGRLAYGDVEGYTESSDPFLKAAGFRALAALVQAGQGDASAFATLTAALADANPEIRGAAARAVALFGNDEAFAALEPLQTDPEPYVLGQLALAYGAFPAAQYAERTSGVLIGFLEGGEPEVVAGAVEALGMLGQVQLKPAILDKIRFPDARVRAAAMRSLVALGTTGETRDVVNALAGQLRDEEPANRVLAATLLGNFNAEISVLALSNVINDPMPELRFAAIEALGRTATASAAPVLVALLEDPAREIRLAAVESLALLRSPVVIPDLQAAAARSTDPVTTQAIQALLESM